MAWRKFDPMKNITQRLRRASRVVLIILGFLAIASGPVRALEPEALAEKIAGSIEAFNLGLGPDQAPYRYNEIDVVALDESYRVTIKGLNLLLDPDEQVRLDVGDVSYTMHPAGDLAGDGLYRISDLEMPSTLVAFSGDGSPLVTVTIAELALDGLWSFAYMTMLSLDLAAEGLTIADPSGGHGAALKAVTADIRSDHKQGDRYDMVFNLGLEQFTASDPEGSAEVGKVTLLSRVTDFDLAAAAALYEELRETMSSETPPEEQIAQMMSLMFGRNFWEVDSETQITVNDLAFGGGPGIPEVSLDSLGFGFSLEDADQKLSRVGLDMTQAGLAVAGGDASLDSPLGRGLMPEETALHLDFERVPLMEIMAMMETMANQAMIDQPAGNGAGGADMEAMMMPAMFQLSELFAQAGTVINIRESGVKTSPVLARHGRQLQSRSPGRVRRDRRAASDRDGARRAAPGHSGRHGGKRPGAKGGRAQRDAGSGDAAGLHQPRPDRRRGGGRSVRCPGRTGWAGLRQRPAGHAGRPVAPAPSRATGDG